MPTKPKPTDDEKKAAYQAAMPELYAATSEIFDDLKGDMVTTFPWLLLLEILGPLLVKFIENCGAKRLHKNASRKGPFRKMVKENVLVELDAMLDDKGIVASDEKRSQLAERFMQVAAKRTPEELTTASVRYAEFHDEEE